jgi:tetratricopeptide (TPR) repeat protein
MIDSIQNSQAVLVGHGGANAGWHAHLSVNQKTRDGFVMITNGGSGSSVYNQAYCDWIEWKLGVSAGKRCKKPITPLLINTFKSEGIEATIDKYKKVKETEMDSYLFSGSTLNNFGYGLLQAAQIKEAIQIFKLNVEEYPESGNGYDSLGEAYLEDGNTVLAIKNYEKAIALDPENTYAVEILKKLKSD